MSFTFARTGLIAAAGLLISTSAFAADCDRACLEGMVDTYFKALIDDNPGEAPLAANVRFTENGQHLPIGEGLWKSMKAAGHYRLFVTDVQAQVVTLLTTVVEDGRNPDSGLGAAMALRLRIHAGEITEIEQMLLRDDRTAKRIEALDQPRKVFLTPVPKDERMSRKDIIATANKYFTGMEGNDGLGDYPFADDCNRFENGMQTTNLPTPEGEKRPDPETSIIYSAQWSCLEQFKSGLLHFVTRIRDRRFVAVDQERGLTMAIDFFDHMAGSTRTFKTPSGKTVTTGPTQPWTWFVAEVFKINDHKIHQIEALLTRPPYGMNSGWSTWEQGLSSQARDVTGVPE